MAKIKSVADPPKFIEHRKIPTVPAEYMDNEGTYRGVRTEEPLDQKIARWGREDLGPELARFGSGLIGGVETIGGTLLGMMTANRLDKTPQERMQPFVQAGEMAKSMVTEQTEMARRLARTAGSVAGVPHQPAERDYARPMDYVELAGAVAPYFRGARASAAKALDMMGENTMRKGVVEAGSILYPRQTVGRFVEAFINPDGGFNAGAYQRYLTKRAAGPVNLRLRESPLERPSMLLDKEARDAVADALFRRKLPDDAGHPFAQDAASIAFDLPQKFGTYQHLRGNIWGINRQSDFGRHLYGEMNQQAREAVQEMMEDALNFETGHITNLARNRLPAWQAVQPQRGVEQIRYTGGPFGRYNLAVDPERNRWLMEDEWYVGPYSRREFFDVMTGRDKKRLRLDELAETAIDDETKIGKIMEAIDLDNYGSTRGGMLGRAFLGAIQRKPIFVSGGHLR